MNGIIMCSVCVYNGSGNGHKYIRIRPKEMLIIMHVHPALFYIPAGKANRSYAFGQE